MVEKIQELLEAQGYLKIDSNVPFVRLYVQYDLSSAKVIQVLDCVDEIPITVEQYEVFCKKSKEHIIERGYESIDFLTLVVTPWTNEARKFVLNDDHCWIVDSRNMSVILFDNEPNDFYGLKSIIESATVTRSTGYVEDYEEPTEGSYSGYYDSSRGQDRTFLQEITPVNTVFVVINVLVFFALSALGSTQDVEFMLGHGAMFVPSVIEDGQVYRFFTCMFLHFGFMHLTGNMVVLMFLGDNVERAVGKVKYVLIYILGGMIGSTGSFLYALKYNPGIVSAGASGAIFALIGALLWLVIRNKGRLEDMTTLRMCVLIAYALYNGITSENVDMAAHLFGLIGGFLVAVILYRKTPNKTIGAFS